VKSLSLSLSNNSPCYWQSVIISRLTHLHMERSCGRTRVYRLQRVVVLLQRDVDITTTRSFFCKPFHWSFTVLAMRSITSHLIGQCLQRVVENYYALSTRIRPQRPCISAAAGICPALVSWSLSRPFLCRISSLVV